MSTSTFLPYPIFFDLDGKPLEDGFVYIGVANMDPQTNPVATFFDPTLLQPAGQPLRTSGGYIYNAGSPAMVYTAEANYSISVFNKNGVFVYNAPSITFRLDIDTTSTLSANNVSFIQTGAGAITRTAMSKMRDAVDVRDFGAVGDGFSDDTQAFIDALASHSIVKAPPTGVYYLISSTINIPVDTLLISDDTTNKTVLRKNFDGTFFTLDSGAGLSGFYLDCRGSTYTGRGIELLNPSGLPNLTSNIHIENVTIWDVNDYCLYIASGAAHDSVFRDVIMFRQFNNPVGQNHTIAYQNAASSGVFANTVFDHLTLFSEGIEFGGSRGVFVSNSSLGSCLFTTNTSYISIDNSTVSLAAASTGGDRIKVTGCTFPGGAFGPGLFTNSVVQSNIGSATVNPGTFPAGTFIDMASTSYTPVFSTEAAGSSLGNGTLTGRYSVIGRRCFFTIHFVVGSTTVITASSPMRFTVPFTNSQSVYIAAGSAYLYDSSSTDPWSSTPKLLASSNQLELAANGVQVQHNQPFTWAVGDMIDIAGSFEIA